MAVYVFAGGETALALRCLYRAKLLMLTVHGEDHPYTAVLDVSKAPIPIDNHLLYTLTSLSINHASITVKPYDTISLAEFFGLNIAGGTVPAVSTERTETQYYFQRCHGPYDCPKVR